MALHKKSGVKNPPPAFAHYARDLPLGPGSVRTEIAGSLRNSVVDIVASTIIAHPNRQRQSGGAIAADAQIKDQLRDVSSKQECPTTFGMRNRSGEK